MGYGNKKSGCLKYITILIVIVLLVCYALAKISPKTFESAKKEAIEKVFGVSINDSTKSVNDSIKTEVKKDSTITLDLPRQSISDIHVDTSLIVLPVEITDHSTYLMAEVNGVNMKFLIDTGCSDMQITSAEFYYMKHLGLISEDDIVGNVTCVYADNSSGKCFVVKLKTVNVGGIELKDVECSIQEDIESSLLLGQSVLKQLGEISIDYANRKLKIKR